MRLTDHEIAAIKEAACEAFGASTVVRLFGSRVDPAKRGGDIDLHLEVEPGRHTDGAVHRFEDVLFRHIDEQRVDMIFSTRGRPPGPFEQIGYRDGIVL